MNFQSCVYVIIERKTGKFIAVYRDLDSIPDKYLDDDLGMEIRKYDFVP